MTVAISLILILFILQPITVRIKRALDTEIYIYFLFFTLILYPERRKLNKKKQNSNKRKKKKGGGALPFFRALRYALRRSEITLYRLKPNYTTDAPSKDALTSEYVTYGVYILITVLSAYSREQKLTYADEPSDKEDSTTLDISFDLSLIDLVFTALIYRKNKKRRKRSA